MAPIDEDELHDRLFAKDPSLFGPRASAGLAFLDAPREMERARRELTRWAATIDEDRVVLLGCGSGAQAIAVYDEVARALEWRGGRRVFICSSPGPEVLAAIPFEEAFVVVLSRSGNSLETGALWSYARSRLSDPKRYALVGESGSPFVRRAEELRVRRIFTSDPATTGYFGALSQFGALAAVLGGYDLEELYGRALEIDRHEAVSLGATLGAAALDGGEQVEIAPEALRAGLGRFTAGLLATATGKSGRGIVAGPRTGPESGGTRLVLPLGIAQAHEAGAAVFRLQIAAAVAALVLDVDPFATPELASASEEIAAVLADPPVEKVPTIDAEALEEAAGVIEPDDYVAVEAYLPEGPLDEARLRLALSERLGGAFVTYGEGAAVRHSTAQLHRDGPPSVVVLQLVSRLERPRLPVPGAPYDFPTVLDAQVLASSRALAARGRRQICVALDDVGELC